MVAASRTSPVARRRLSRADCRASPCSTWTVAPPLLNVALLHVDCCTSPVAYRPSAHRLLHFAVLHVVDLSTSTVAPQPVERRLLHLALLNVGSCTPPDAYRPALPNACCASTYPHRLSHLALSNVDCCTSRVHNPCFTSWPHSALHTPQVATRTSRVDRASFLVLRRTPQAARRALPAARPLSQRRLPQSGPRDARGRLPRTAHPDLMLPRSARRQAGGRTALC